MRITALLLSFCIVAFSANSQNADSVTRDFRNMGRKNAKKPKADRLVFNLTLDNLTYKRNDSFSVKWLSPGIGFYGLWDKQIGKSNFSLGYGLGFTFSSCNTNRILHSDTSGIDFYRPIQFDSLLGVGDRFRGGTFSTSYLEMPLELRFRKEINGKDFFKVAIGMRVGLKLSSSYDFDAYYPAIGEEKNYRVSSFSQVSTFRYGPTFRIGYGAVNLFGFYGISKLFKGTTEKSNSDFHQFSIGISINGL